MKNIFDRADVERMRIMYEEEGLSSGEIARVMFCFPTTVRRYLRDAGVQLRPKGGSKPLKNVSHQEMELIRFLYWYEEWSIEMIAEHLGVNKSTVLHRMTKGGIPRRNRVEGGKVAYRQGRNLVGNQRVAA